MIETINLILIVSTFLLLIYVAIRILLKFDDIEQKLVEIKI